MNPLFWLRHFGQSAWLEQLIAESTGKEGTGTVPIDGEPPGPPTGVFIQVVDEPSRDLPIPGKPYTFRRLLDAQSAGDLQALRARGRKVARARLSDLEEVS